MSYQFIFVDREDGIVTITLNRPEVLNALTFPMLAEMKSALEEAEQDPTVKVAILKGAGRGFCSGLDLRQVANTLTTEQQSDDIASVLYYDEFDLHAGPIRQVFDLLWRSPVITIAQIHGSCVQSGWVLAALSDLALIADDAKIIWRPVGGSGLVFHMWPWTVGLRKTKELLFRAEYITGKEAAELGMVNRSVPAESLDEAVRELATKIARRPREFLYLDKKVTNKAFEMMGLWNAWDYSITAHVISHAVPQTRELADAFAKQSTHEVKDMLSARVTPRGG